MQNTFYDEHQYYLAHHGILGMKWGKKNGPPYPLSDAKHNKIIKQHKDINMFRESIKKGMGKGLKNPSAISNPTRNALQSTKSIHEKIKRQKKQAQRKDYRDEYSKMTDNEIRRVLNRATLERQYNELRNSQETKQGNDYIGDALDYAIDVTAIAGSLLTIAYIASNFKK